MSYEKDTKMSESLKRQIERMPEKAFVVWLSTGKAVKIDADELDLIEQACARGGIAKVRQGFINPSYIVTVMLDYDRLARLLEERIIRERGNSFEKEYGTGSTEMLPTLSDLPDITGEASKLVRIGTILEAGEE